MNDDQDEHVFVINLLTCAVWLFVVIAAASVLAAVDAGGFLIAALELLGAP